MEETTFIKFVKEAFDLTISKELLQVPTSSFVKDLYVLFLTDFGITNLHQPDLNAIQGISNLERMDEAIENINITVAMQHILSRTAFKGTFTVMDLAMPHKRKTMVILSYLARLWTNIAELREKWNQLEIECEPEIQRIRALEEDIKNMKDVIEKKSLKVAQKRPQNEKRKQLLASLSAQLQVKIDRSNHLTETYQSEKRELVALKEQLAEQQVLCAKLDEEIAELQDLLVSSPEKYQSQVRLLEQQLQCKVNELGDAKTELSKLSALNETIVKVIKDESSMFETSKEQIETLFSQLKEKCDINDQVKKECESLKLQQQTKELSMNCAISEFKRKEEQLRKLRIKHEKEMVPLRELTKGLQDTLKQRKDQLASTVGQLNEKERQLQQEINRIDHERTEFEKQLERLLSRVENSCQLVCQARLP